MSEGQRPGGRRSEGQGPEGQGPEGQGPEGQGPEGRRPDEVGSVGEEAAKLLGAISGWADEQGAGTGAGLGAGFAGLAGHAAAAVREVEEHLATGSAPGSAPCTYCPICRTVHAVRQTSPEVRSHLASAASSLLQAAAGLLATAVPPERQGAGRAPGAEGVEHIDLDEDWPEDER